MTFNKQIVSLRSKDVKSMLTKFNANLTSWNSS